VLQNIQQAMETANEGGDIRPRNPGLALALSICPGLGHHYAGHLARGIIYYIGLVLISWLAAIAFMYVDSRISMIFLATPFVGVTLIALDAYRCAKNQPQDYKRRWFNRGYIYAGVFLTLAVTVNPIMDQIAGKHIVRAYFISSPGMHPTILTRDIILVNKMAFPEKSEIALIEFGDDEAGQLTKLDGSQLVGRIIGEPGDIVEVNAKGVYINGKQLYEPYASFQETTRTGPLYDETSHFGPEQVPKDAYFILADNRTYGFDSRILGFIEKAKIGGKVTKVFWSWNTEDGGLHWERTAMSLK